METKLTFLTDLNGNDYEFKLTVEDARLGCHQGECEEDCNSLRQVPYIREQLELLSDEEMLSILRNYGMDMPQNFRRNEVESFIIWLAAGNINDQED